MAKSEESALLNGLSAEDIKILSAKFPDDRLNVKINTFNKEKPPTRAMLVLYLQHTDVYDRLESVDPSWSCQTIGSDKIQDSVFVRMQLTVKGVTRENVGEGSDFKGAYSDALKRAAMLFGVGRYLYDIETVWVPYNEATDRFKKYTVSEFREAYNR